MRSETCGSRRLPAPLALGAICLGLLGACDTSPTGLREWTPDDHQHTTKSGAQAKGQVDGEEKEIFPGVDQVVVATWTSKCVLCHGQVGRGNGPQAAMYKPKDLSDPAWQAGVTDEQIIESIQKGKGKMPAFMLPEKTAEGLAKLVRLFNRDKSARQAAGVSPTASASASASPSDRPANAPEKTDAPEKTGGADADQTTDSPSD